LSTQRKTKDKLSSSSGSAREVLSKTTDAERTGGDWLSSLPLDWTRMHQRDPLVDGGTSVSCCEKPETCRLEGRTRPLSKATRKYPPTVTTTISGKDDDDVVDTSNKFSGQAIFCLHDDDPSWIQGYFIPRGSTKPWGMLAIQEEVDDCTGCRAGGYRRLSLTVYHRSESHGQSFSKNGPNHSDSISKRKKIRNTNSCQIDGVDWRGGDMITLYHPRYVDMEAERLLTEKKALPILHKYFQGLINRLEKECCVKKGLSVLEWLPNVAIVTGSMSLTLPMD